MKKFVEDLFSLWYRSGWSIVMVIILAIMFNIVFQMPGASSIFVFIMMGIVDMLLAEAIVSLALMAIDRVKAKRQLKNIIDILK